MGGNTSVNAKRHPYLRPEIFHPYWRCGLYSQDEQAKMEQWLSDAKDSKKNPEVMEVRRSQK